MPMEMLMWEDEETSCAEIEWMQGRGGRNAQALRIVTRSNMLLTQSVDEDETESAGISLDDGVSAYCQQFIGGSVCS